MSKETPNDDSQQRSDKGSMAQTDIPWNGNPEREQKGGASKEDLEKWQKSDTH